MIWGVLLASFTTACGDSAALHRLSTAGLLTILCMLYPRWYTVFLGLLMLDVGSHWLQMQATLVSGAASHKVGPHLVVDSNDLDQMVMFHFTGASDHSLCLIFIWQPEKQNNALSLPQHTVLAEAWQPFCMSIMMLPWQACIAFVLSSARHEIAADTACMCSMLITDCRVVAQGCLPSAPMPGIYPYAVGCLGCDLWQDKESRSMLVRFYYRHRIFMGVCCICCEVLYLALYLLHWPDIWSLPHAQLPPQLANTAPLQSMLQFTGQGWP